jgi:Fur family ferric uptake transcriptional regulator
MSARVAARRSERTALVARLHAGGLKRTAPRVAVLELLARSDAPLSHAQIADALGFDRATLYRNLVDLTRAGLVTRSDHGDHIWRFALLLDGEIEHGRQHPHFVCGDCGSVTCLPGVKVKISPPRGQKRIAELEVQLKGLCVQCHGVS